jgi:ribosome-binding ATPase YchF (GTP1/OBG family)
MYKEIISENPCFGGAIRINDKLIMKNSVAHLKKGDVVTAVSDHSADQNSISVKGTIYPEKIVTVYRSELAALSLTLESLERNLEDAKKYIADTEDKISWMKSNNLTEFKDQEFAVYKVIEKLEDTKLTALEKSRFIVELLKLEK